MEPIETSHDFVHGFNNAYLIAEYEPDLLMNISAGDNPENEYFDGFFAGKAQWQEEQELQQLSSLREQQNKRDLEQDIPHR
jgi:hypothetical protein